MKQSSVATLEKCDDPRQVSIRQLHLPGCATPVGYHVAGMRRGPTLLVAGQGDVIGAAYRRILTLPSLPWIRGNLLLVHFEDKYPDLDTKILDEAATRFSAVDDTLHLIGSADDRQDVYWTILRFVAQYGMISGRGVQTHTPEVVFIASGQAL